MCMCGAGVVCMVYFVNEVPYILLGKVCGKDDLSCEVEGVLIFLV